MNENVQGGSLGESASAAFFEARLLVLECARCRGWTDVLKERLCLWCHARPWEAPALFTLEEIVRLKIP